MNGGADPDRTSVGTLRENLYEVVPFLIIGSLVGVGFVALAVVFGVLNPRIANTLLTVLLVAVTAIYALVTQVLVRETRRNRYDQVRPLLHLKYDPFGPHVVNVGQGPARKIRLDFELSAGAESTDAVSEPIEADFLSESDELWIREEPFRKVTVEGTELRDEYQTLKIQGGYEDMYGNVYEVRAEHSFDEIRGRMEKRSDPIEDIAERLKGIEAELETIRIQQQD